MFIGPTDDLFLDLIFLCVDPPEQQAAGCDLASEVGQWICGNQCFPQRLLNFRRQRSDELVPIGNQTIQSLTVYFDRKK